MKKNKVKLTENGLKKLIKESTAKILKEMETENVPYEAWSEYLHGKEPLFEFEDDIIYVDYDENNGTLCSGHVTNVGFHKDGEVEVPVYDGNFQAALEEVYDQLSCNHEGLCENKERKPKLTKSHLQKIINENIKRVLKEGHWNSDVYDEFSKLREALGDDTLISELYNWMDSSEIEEFIQNTKRMYDLDGSDEQEDSDAI